ADLYVVDMNRPIRVRLPIRLVGSSPAVGSLSGVLVRGIPHLGVGCFAGGLGREGGGGLAVLQGIGHSVHRRDLAVPPAIKVLTDPDDQVARVTYQAKEEDLSTPTTATSEVEVIEKGKTEEEGEEGEGKPAATKTAAKTATKSAATKTPAA